MLRASTVRTRRSTTGLCAGAVLACSTRFSPNWRPVIMLLSEGQMSDYKGAALTLPAPPKAEELLGDKGYDANWFRQALAERGITACIPSKSNRRKPIEHDRTLYRQRHKIEN